MRGALVEPPTHGAFIRADASPQDDALPSPPALGWPVGIDVLPAAFGASFPADDSALAAPVPTLPAQDVLSKAVSVTFSLMKPTSTFT